MTTDAPPLHADIALSRLKDKSSSVRSVAAARRDCGTALLAMRQSPSLCYIYIYMTPLLRNATQRNAQVRKYSMQLLRMLLESNPFAGDLNLAKFQEKLASVKKALGDEDELEAEAEAEAEVKEAEVKAEPEAEAEAEAVAEAEAEAEAEVKAEEKIVVDKDEKLLQQRRKFLASAVGFITSLHNAIDTLQNELLDSKTTSDATEAIAFLVLANAFNVTKSARPAPFTSWSLCGAHS